MAFQIEKGGNLGMGQLESEIPELESAPVANALDDDDDSKDKNEKWSKVMIIQPIEGPQSNFFHVKESGARIGRHSHNDIVIMDESVSRNHAHIAFKDNVFLLKDIGSTTGTYIKITNNILLEKGMIIEIGSYQFQVVNIFIAPKLTEKDTAAAKEREKSFIELEIIDSPEEVVRAKYKLFENGTIGRKQNNNISFVDDLHMSNTHCKINLVGDKYFLEDLSSTNGY